jgi:hypothetical protein
MPPLSPGADHAGGGRANLREALLAEGLPTVAPASGSTKTPPVSPMRRGTPVTDTYLDLQNQARRAKRPTQELHQLYILEGFLGHLAMSEARNSFVLKGGVLLAACSWQQVHLGPVSALSEHQRLGIGSAGLTSPRSQRSTALSRSGSAPAQ